MTIFIESLFVAFFTAERRFVVSYPVPRKFGAFRSSVTDLTESALSIVSQNLLVSDISSMAM